VVFIRKADILKMDNHQERAVIIYFVVLLVVGGCSLYSRFDLINLGYVFAVIICFLRFLFIVKGSR